MPVGQDLLTVLCGSASRSSARRRGSAIPGQPAQEGRSSLSSGEGRFLLLSATPLREPVARYGPFVMSTRAELVTAFQDYEAGRIG